MQTSCPITHFTENKLFIQDISKQCVPMPHLLAYGFTTKYTGQFFTSENLLNLRLPYKQAGIDSISTEIPDRRMRERSTKLIGEHCADGKTHIQSS